MRAMIRLVACLALLPVLASCGGEGALWTSDAGGPADPQEPGGVPSVPPLAPVLELEQRAVKLFSFSWNSVEDATSYRLFEAADHGAGFIELTDLPAEAVSYEREMPLHLRVNARYVLEACNAVGCTESNVVSVTGTLEQAVGYIKASHGGSGQEPGHWHTFGSAVAIDGRGETLAIGVPLESSGARGIENYAGDADEPLAGAVYVFARHGTGAWVHQAYIKASNAGREHYFGRAVALSSNGDILAVGAPGEDSAGRGVGADQSNRDAPGAGAVYVFARSGQNWSQQAYLKASNAEGFLEFGHAVALDASGSILSVGSPFEDSSATGVDGDQDDNDAWASGAAYVFSRDGDSWRQDAYIKAGNARAHDRFGWSLALSGNGRTLAVGATGQAGGGSGVDSDPLDDHLLDAGAAYVFVREGNSWMQQAFIKASNPGINSLFGEAVTLDASGSTLAVGAPYEASGATGIDGDQHDTSSPGAGAAYVFGRVGAAWAQQAYLKPSNTTRYHIFGTSLALSGSGDSLAIGAPGEEGGAVGINGNENMPGVPGAGAVYVFGLDGAAWSQRAYVKASNTDTVDESDYFGDAVAMAASGAVLAVGAPGEASGAVGVGGDQEDSSIPARGAVYLY